MERERRDSIMTLVYPMIVRHARWYCNRYCHEQESVIQDHIIDDMCAYLVKTIDAFQEDFTPPQWNMWVKKFTWLRASQIFKREQNRYAKVDYLEKKSQDLTSQVETQDKYQRVMYVMNNQKSPHIKLGMKMLEKYAIGYKYEELADRYNVPVGTVKNHIHMARKTLKQAV